MDDILLPRVPILQELIQPQYFNFYELCSLLSNWCSFNLSLLSFNFITMQFIKDKLSSTSDLGSSWGVCAKDHYFLLHSDHNGLRIKLAMRQNLESNWIWMKMYVSSTTTLFWTLVQPKHPSVAVTEIWKNIQKRW